MSASVAATSTPAPEQRAVSAGRSWPRLDIRYVAPTLFTAINAVAFYVLRPDVNDLTAARARASAVAHGVGLTYWFSWFGGGSTPGSYSVVTPALSALIGTELLTALAAVAVTIIGTVAVRGTRYPLAGACAVAVAATTNLWSGRVPFLLGGALAIGAVIALRHRNRPATVGLTMLSMLASPVSGAFLAMGLSGTFLTTRTRAWRPIIAWCVAAVVVAGLAVTLGFGNPGPEPFSTGLALEVVGGLILLWFAKPPDHVRTTVYWSFVAVAVLYLVPNGLGSNFSRFVWFCLPVLAIAASRRRLWVAALFVAPVLAAGVGGTIADLHNATKPVSSIDFYNPLSAKLDAVADLKNYRVEVVNHGAHAGYDALLGHVMLARGWETQEDTALNESLRQDPLDPVTYKVWLDNNAVGYVALPSASVGDYPEYDLVKSHRAPYLHLVWRSADWQLFRVDDPTPIAAVPARVRAHSQSSLTVAVPCTCTIALRVRWSKFLAATPAPAHGRGTPPPAGARADLAEDGFHWTTLTTTRPGVYVLSGSIRGFLR